MTHATSLVHCYQLSGICVHRDKDFLKRWAINNLDFVYSKFLITEDDVNNIDILKPMTEENKSNKSQPTVDSPKKKSLLNLMIENIKKFQRGDKESQTNTEGEIRKKSLIFSTPSEPMIDMVRDSMQREPPDREDRVKLFIDLADMNKNPDTFDETERKTGFSEKEGKSVDYVYRRRLTMGISSSITDVIQQLAKIQYEFSHPLTVETLQRELLGRVASLSLSYGYP
ncbi:hypothetical protein C2G38_2042907 [Gigaspora rosea]|uniref:Uncharacterized protein n=1 Tax=Gigaspora rosea TaxID=44941 RepID=A0A397ULM9_9GLOM